MLVDVALEDVIILKGGTVEAVREVELVAGEEPNFIVNLGVDLKAEMVLG